MEVPLNDAIFYLTDQLAKRGLKTGQSHDWDRFERVMQMLRPEGASGQFKGDGHWRKSKNSFWLYWVDLNELAKIKGPVSEGMEDKCIVATHAMRKEETDAETDLATVWEWDQVDLYGGGTLGADQPPIVYEMKGTVIYAGDYFLKVKYRKDNLHEPMALYTFFLAEQKWKPDWIYGFMNEKLARRGFAETAGYASTDPRGTHWIVPPPNINPNDKLVYMNRANLVQRIVINAMMGLDVLKCRQAEADRLALDI